MISWLLLLGGLAILSVGAEFLVRGSAALALRLGLTPLVVGLTVVGFGTSSPEMVVSIKGALAGQGDLAVGNVVGSNIFNVAVILGLTVLVKPIKIGLQLIRLDTPIMIGSLLLMLALIWDGTISRPEAFLLFALLIAYLYFTVRAARNETKQIQDEYANELPKADTPVWLDAVFIVLGLAGLIFGGQMFINGSVSLARAWGISDAIIGLTVVAAGTSMPELATSIIAALRKNPDIAIGNVIGSNIFNVLGILGVSGMLAPIHAPGISHVDLWLMTGISMLLIPLMMTGFTLRRWEGGVLLAIYGGYLWHLWP